MHKENSPEYFQWLCLVVGHIFTVINMGQCANFSTITK